VANILSLNVKKSNFLSFSNQKDKVPPVLKIQDTVIETKEVARYLRILIDNKLNWSYQIKAVNQKISQGLEILHVVRELGWGGHL